MKNEIMITTMSTIKLRALAVLVILVCFFASCTNRMNKVQDAVLCKVEPVECIVPISHNGKVDLLCYDPLSLYHCLNIKIISEDAFLEFLLRSIQHNIPIVVTNEFYEQVKDCIVEENVDMASEYNSFGFPYILEKYSSSLNDMVKTDHGRYCYFVYLCWQNGCYVYFDDEDGRLQISL